jgi:hypothetical protein
MVVRDLLFQSERTWATGQLAVWLAEEHRVVLSKDHLGALLRRAKWSCRRTERSLEPKQDLEALAANRAELVSLDTMKSGGG